MPMYTTGTGAVVRYVVWILCHEIQSVTTDPAFKLILTVGCVHMVIHFNAFGNLSSSAK